MITASMTWITPFVASISAAVTFSPSTITPLSRSIITVSPVHCGGFHVIGEVCGHHFPCDHVVGEDAGQHLFVLWLEQFLNCAFWQGCECGICWSEDCERAVTFQCLDQTCGFCCGQKCAEVASGCCCVDDVFCVTCCKGRSCHCDCCGGGEKCLTKHGVILILVSNAFVSIERDTPQTAFGSVKVRSIFS